MVLLRRHFVPNPVPFSETGFVPPCKLILVLHTRYDVNNHLVGKLTDPDGVGEEEATDEYFAYDGNQVLFRFAGPSLSDLADRYLWAPVVDLLLSDEKLTAPDEPGDIYWALQDNLNTVRDIAHYDPQTDVCSVANHRIFDAFGNMTSQTNAAVDLIFGFTGRQRDGDTGLQNNWRRWYDPGAGRWLSEDPLGFKAGDANVFRYVHNGATFAVDPSGLEWVWWSCTKGFLQSFFVDGPCDIAVGAWNTGREVVCYARDVGAVGYDAFAYNTGWVKPADFDMWSQSGRNNRIEGNPDFWANSFKNAGRAGLAGGTAGLSEMGSATYEYIVTGDGRVYRQRMGATAAGNLAGAGAIKGGQYIGRIARGSRATSGMPARVTMNRQAGLTFQQQVTGALGARPAGAMRGSTVSGAPYTTTPDGILPTGGLLEVKGGQYISNSAQLQAQVWLGRQPGNVPSTLVVGPQSTVSGPVIRGYGHSLTTPQIFRYDPATGTLTPYP